MKLYYTTSVGEDEVQKETSISLGGYKSSTQIPNGRDANLFGEITPYTIGNNNPQYIGIILKNDTGSTVTGTSFYFNVQSDCYSKFEVAAVSMSEDSEGTFQMERVQDIYSQPYTGTFYEANGVSNAVSLGSIENNGQIGLWVRRSLLTDVIQNDYSDRITLVGGSEYIYEETELSTSDNFSIVISWD